MKLLATAKSQNAYKKGETVEWILNYNNNIIMYKRWWTSFVLLPTFQILNTQQLEKEANKSSSSSRWLLGKIGSTEVKAKC